IYVSPLPGDAAIDSREVKATWSLRQNRYFARADIRYRLPVPQDLESRRAKRRDGAVDVALRLTIPVSEPIIDLRIELNNRAKDHRLRLHVPTGIEADRSTADQPFGVIERPVVDEAIEVWEEEGWAERPDPILPDAVLCGTVRREGGRRRLDRQLPGV